MAKQATLSANDRKQLVKITEGRFEILRNELSIRRNEIEREINKQVVAEHEKDITEIRKALDKWAEQEKKMHEKHDAEADALRKKQTQEVELHKSERNDIYDIASRKKLTIQKPGYGTEKEKITPENLANVVKNRMDSFENDYLLARKQLKTQELDVIEKISVSGLESPDSIDFLGQIPDVDTLLPPLNEAKELISAK